MDNFTEFLYSKFLQSHGVSIDTRTLQPENLFFGIKGPNFDGGAYALQALEKGASFAIVQDEKYVTKPSIILVEDTTKALQDLAIFHRSRFTKKRVVFALTGSNGKTTTKELISRVLSKKYITHATSGNYNNHLGVPITLLHIHPQVEISIIEMGANRVGDIAELCGIANPTHGLITNIGHAHTETFGGIEGVLRGKSELFDHLRKNDGQVFINALDPALSNMAKRFSNPVIYPPNDLTLVAELPTLALQLNNFSIPTNLVGAYNFSNIAAAVTLGRFFGVNDQHIADAISTYHPDNWRSQFLQKGNVSIILDAYNANPTSMELAIINLGRYQGKKMAILGGMEEVENSVEAHRILGKQLSENNIDSVLLVGPKTKPVKDEFSKAKWFETKPELEKYLVENKPENCTVLIKASRAAKLENIPDKL